MLLRGENDLFQGEIYLCLEENTAIIANNINREILIEHLLKQQRKEEVTFKITSKRPVVLRICKRGYDLDLSRSLKDHLDEEKLSTHKIEKLTQLFPMVDFKNKIGEFSLFEQALCRLAVAGSIGTFVIVDDLLENLSIHEKKDILDIAKKLQVVNSVYLLNLINEKTDGYYFSNLFALKNNKILPLKINKKDGKNV